MRTDADHLIQPPTLHTVTVRVPASGVVRLPGRYAHEFASVPEFWREVSGIGSKFVDFPQLDPASERSLFRYFPDEEDE